MNKQLEKVTESPELIEELYHHWCEEYYYEEYYCEDDNTKDQTFAYNKYQYYRNLMEELCHD